MPRDFSALSDHDFEQLVADLLGKDEETRYETFMRGPDNGIDLRRIDADGSIHVVQCKHFRRSTFSQLLSAARSEAKKIRERGDSYASYRFVTSQELSQPRKDKIYQAYGSIMRNADDVYGADDLEGLLNDHQSIERAHVKLWLSSGAQLDRIVNASIWNRSQHLVDDVRRTLDRYVETGIFSQAKNQLAETRVLIISGPPGIGKTTLARMLLADCAVDGFSPIDVSADVEEAYSVLDQSSQAFYLDDFLGSTFLQDRLAKNEDKRLTALMRRCATDKSKLMILSTREHILQQATTVYEALQVAVTDPRKILLALNSYSDLDKGRILYNHLWHSQQVSDGARKQVVAGRKYLRIIRHDSYNPRVIEYVTGLAAYALTESDIASYPEFVLRALDNPSLIWTHAFEQQLDDDCKDVLIVLATTPRNTCSAEDLLVGFQGQRDANGRESKRNGFRDALRVLDDAFTRSTEAHGRTTLIELADPGLEDYVAEWLAGDTEASITAIDGVVSFDQVQWLYRRIVEPGHPTRGDELLDHLLIAAIRTWRTGNFSWHDVHYDDDPEPTLSRRTVDISTRLLLLVEICEATSIEHGDARAFINDQVENLTDHWESSHYLDFATRCHLVEKLLATGLISGQRFGLILLYLVSKAYDAYSWQRLDSLRQKHADLLAPSTTKSIRSAFRHWLDSQLVEPDNIEDTYQFSQILTVARDLQVYPPKALVNDARSRIESRNDDDEPASTVEPRNAKDAGDSNSDEEAELHLLFGRLLSD